MSPKTWNLKTNVKQKEIKPNEYLFEMDETDKKILRTLLADCRLSHREIARRNQLSVSTVIERLRKLKSNGILDGFYAKINAEKFGYNITAIIEVMMPRGLLRQGENEIAKYPNVYGVYDTTGRCDTLIVAKFRSMDELNEFLKFLQSKEYIKKTETHLVLKTIKEDFRVII